MHYGNTFDRIGGADSLASRMDMLDRLVTAGHPLVTLELQRQYYKVFWKKVAKHTQKWVKVCSKSGRVISTNCRGLTEASLDVHLKVLYEIEFRKLDY